jgi:hypothetical protein
MNRTREAGRTERGGSRPRQDDRRQERGAREERGARALRLAVLLVAALVPGAGCAPMAYPPASPPAPAAPRPAEPAGGPAPTRAEPAPPVARVDTLPSPEAERVLATIPDPLPGAVRPGVARDSTRPRPVVAPEAGYDTLRVERTPEDAAAGVPVPAPTRALGSPSPVAPDPAESLAARPPVTAPAAPAVAPPTGAPPASPPTGATSPAPGPPAGGAPAVGAGGPCWRVQVAAPATREEAESRHAAAQSLLLVEMVIEPEKGLFKVRTRSCLPREAASAVKQRALDSGFDGSFLVDTAAKPAGPPASPRRPARRSGARR